LKKKILIVGGTGFIGYHLAKKCIKKKFKVTSLSYSKPKKKRFLKKVRYLFCDISKKNNLYKLKLKNFDYVVNLGGYVNHKEKAKTFNSHFRGCKNLADFFLDRKIKKFIQIGSCVEYGHLKSPQFEKKINFNQKLKSAYGEAKLLASKYLYDLFRKYNFPFVVLRLYLVYGPQQDINRLIPITIESCFLNKKFDCSNGTQKRDFLYIDDLIKAIFKAFNNSKILGKSINIGFGKSYTVKSVIKLISDKIGLGNPIYGKIQMRKDEIIKLYPSITLAKKLLKWKPKISLEKGLDLTISNFKNKIKNR
tara:strand:- start:2587 stop:3507 length:921 start_codon:yes stop_codon:yes gene_type:complete